MQRFAVFDIDKTLYKGTLAQDFVTALIEGGVIPKTQQSAQNYLSLRAANSSLAEQDGALVKTLKEAQASGEMDFSRYAQIGAEVAQQALQQTKLFERTKALFDKFKKEGRTLIAISTSPYVVVFPFCQALDFNFILAPMAQNIAGKVGPRSIIKADEKNKGEWLQELVTMLGLRYEDSFAIGDSGSDISMLSLVQNPLVFNPDPALQQEATERGWQVLSEEI